MSALPVAGCKFLGKVAFDVAGLGAGPPCLRVDSEETLLTVIDERAQLACAAPGVTPVDSSEEGAPVRELIQLSVLGEPLVNSLQEPMPAEEQLGYAISSDSRNMATIRTDALCCVRRRGFGFLRDGALGRRWDAMIANVVRRSGL